MREILFRGRVGQKGTWRYGDLLHRGHNLPYIRYKRDGRQFLVNEDTVGQYTGMTDKNGTKIFEGDILFGTCVMDAKESYVFRLVVFWFDGGFSVQEGHYSPEPIDGQECKETEVIGNIYDNPELLNVQPE